jgi:hypothetical protein
MPSHPLAGLRYPEKGNGGGSLKRTKTSHKELQKKKLGS